MTSKSHEDLSRVHEVKIGSERNFGLTFAVFFLLLGALQWYHDGNYRLYAFGAALAFALAAFAAPWVLRPFNQVWARIGLAIAKVAQPLVLGLLFYVILTPFSLVFRLFTKRPLGIGHDVGAHSYWIVRQPRTADDFKNQF